jgi:hypothetical protein
MNESLPFDKFLSNQVHIPVLQATVLAQLGTDQERLPLYVPGRHSRLPDVHATVVNDFLRLNRNTGGNCSPLSARP